MTARFTGKVALVTGAASGMGQATAIRLAAEGASVACTDVNAEGAQQTVDTITQAGGTAMGFGQDVTQEEQCQAAVAKTVAEYGKLDILCNIAGLGGLKPFLDETSENWNLTMAVNVNGPFYMCQAAIPHLLEQKGKILNVCSTAGVKGQAYMSAYVSSKHALAGLTKTLALEFGRQGLRTNAVCPGSTMTPFLQNFQLPEGIELDLIGRSSLLPDFASPEDMASMICYAVSDEAHFVNGAMLAVDGGTVAG